MHRYFGLTRFSKKNLEIWNFYVYLCGVLVKYNTASLIKKSITMDSALAILATVALFILIL